MNVTEKTTAYLTAVFNDKDDVPQIPNSASYQVHNPETGKEVRATTVLTPASTIEITLDKNDNTLVDTLVSEPRKVTVSAVYGALDEVHNIFEYNVEALQFIA
jgi:hypothetical protein